VDDKRIERVTKDFGAVVTGLDAIYAATADIFAPCALGGILNDRTIPQLKAKVVAGAANNQLLEPRHGEALREKGILYAPDYAANAGGVINGCCMEMLGWDQARTAQKIDAICETLLKIFRMAAESNISTSQAADRLAEERLIRGAATSPQA
jgi:leucine dehydrogenase